MFRVPHQVGAQPGHGFQLHTRRRFFVPFAGDAHGDVRVFVAAVIVPRGFGQVHAILDDAIRLHPEGYCVVG
jgi:hypothetical protein